LIFSKENQYHANKLFANAMVIGQLCGNLLGGIMSQWVGLGNVFYVSAAIKLLS
jgi:predicted MFS family arabinose efflux permease